jgi:hypothetical protein
MKWSKIYEASPNGRLQTGIPIFAAGNSARRLRQIFDVQKQLAASIAKCPQA